MSKGWPGEKQRHSMSARGVVSDFNKHNQWMQEAIDRQTEWKLKQQEHDSHRRTVITTALYDIDIPTLRSVQSVDVNPLFYRDGVESYEFYAEITFDGQIKRTGYDTSESPDDLDSTEGYYYYVRAEPSLPGLRKFITFYVSGDVQAIPEIKKKIEKMHKELSK